MTRRANCLSAFLSICLGLVLIAGAAAAAPAISVHDAYEQAGKGEILLIDIRSADEWRATGIATVAQPISMHEQGFFERLDAAVGGDHSKAVALICSSGGRAAWMQVQLLARGYTNVVNVAEGMEGGSNGPGWITSGLPLMPYGQ
ncbi:MAG: rhodanese-like domain-containing protein [Hyphomicrobiales bacterium]|nr:rhodanese-like domain-containing protein [Hyphomicrobiales bacterium]